MNKVVHNPLEILISEEELQKRPYKNATAIDPPHPLEVDDAIFTEPINKAETEHHIEVHIADAGLLYGHSDIIDAAREKGWTIYAENETESDQPMLPEYVYKNVLGLDSNLFEAVPTIEISFDFSFISRAIGNIQVQKAQTKVDAISYKDHDKLLKRKGSSEETIRAKQRLGIARRLFQEPGKLNTISGQRRSEDLVAFFMIATNRIMALEMQDQEIPWLFRNNTGQAHMSWRDSHERRILEKINAGSYGRVPLQHEGLGIESYCHFTSPLRRFPDLANHLNLHAYLSGEDPPYDEKEIDQIALEMTELYIKRANHHFAAA